MITVRNDTGTEDIFLTTVDHFSSAEDAAMALWSSIHEASKSYGGKALLRTPADGENGFLVRWENGPSQWADAYAVSEGASAREFACMPEDGTEIRFVDLD